MTDGSEASILIEEVDDAIVVIRLNRPLRLHALTREMVAELNEALDAMAGRCPSV